MAKPVLVLVDDEDASRQALARELESRYGTHYRIVSSPSPETALARLTEFRAQGVAVPLVLADHWMPGMTGTEFLARVKDVVPTARRGLLTLWGDRSTFGPILEALALGQMDFYVFRPAWSPDEQFHRAITESLGEWWREQGGRFEAVTVIGEEPSARIHEIRDVLARSGAELALRASDQAWGFGAHFIYGNPATSLAAGQGLHVAGLEDGSQIRSRAVVIATGVSYRRLGIAELESLAGAGVFYGASTIEAQAVAGKSVFVVGGGNSAGQAALHLAKYAERVTLLVRSQSLAASMSDYLTREIANAANVHVRYRSEVAGGGGDGRLEHLLIRDRDSGRTESLPAAGLFILIGAQPFTGWLPDAIARDQWGFILTGPDAAPHWPLARAPFPFETTTPGVFAVGDVRHGSVKRVASAVGEGSIVIRLVHDYLALALQTTPEPPEIR